MRRQQQRKVQCFFFGLWLERGTKQRTWQQTTQIIGFISIILVGEKINTTHIAEDSTVFLCRMVVGKWRKTKNMATKILDLLQRLVVGEKIKKMHTVPKSIVVFCKIVVGKLGKETHTAKHYRFIIKFGCGREEKGEAHVSKTYSLLLYGDVKEKRKKNETATIGIGLLSKVLMGHWKNSTHVETVSIVFISSVSVSMQRKSMHTEMKFIVFVRR